MRTHATLLPMVVFTGLALAGSSGCATVMNGSRQSVEFQSRPGGATVLVDGQVMGGTPLTASLERDRTHHVRIGLPGYLTFDMLLERRTSGWAWGNLLLGSAGLIGIVVDALTGAMYALSPRHLAASAMLGHQMVTSEQGDRLVILVALSPEVRPGWRPLGCVTRAAPPPPEAPPAVP